ncbi:MAG: EMC3/TMCO1 family protein [Candidatus Woesearchaeota archaeon]
MVLDNFFLWHIHPGLAIFLICFVINFVIILVYKYTTDQKEMKRLKEQLSKYQKEMREAKNNTKKLMEIQKKSMEVNFKYMKHSFKSTLYTFLPIIILFAWLNSHIAYEQILPNTEFNVTAIFDRATQPTVTLESNPPLKIDKKTKNIVDNTKADWVLSGEEGSYVLTFIYKNNTYDKKLVISSLRKYEQPVLAVNDKTKEFKKIIIGNKEIKPFEGVPVIGRLSWIWVYIIFSILMSIGLRKIMKVY